MNTINDILVTRVNGWAVVDAIADLNHLLAGWFPRRDPRRDLAEGLAKELAAAAMQAGRYSVQPAFAKVAFTSPKPQPTEEELAQALREAVVGA